MKPNFKIISLIPALALVILAGCRDENTSTGEATATGSPAAQQQVDPSVVNNPMTASEEKPSSNKLPEITFSEESFDFGKIKQGEVVNHQFKFKNTGKADLIITSASGSCGCTVPNWPKQPIPPGKEETIDIVYNSAGKTGMQRVNVTLVANTIPNSKVLTVTGEVEAPAQ